MSDSLQSHRLQHTRLPCPSPTPGAYSNSCPLSRWCHPNISSSVVPLLLPSIFPNIRVFSKESVLHIRLPKYWSFSISPSNEHSELISFRMDWLDLLAVQGTLKSLLPHHSLKVSILWHSAFFIVQLSHPYLTTQKTIALIIWTFAGKVMSLLFNTLFRFVTVFLPRNKCLLISWLQFSSVQFNSVTVVSDSFWLHEPQHARPLCPTPTAGVYPNPYPLSWWCHPTISSSVVPFSSCLLSFPGSRSFPMSLLFTSGGQSLLEL